MTKVLLAVDEDFISDFKEHIERDNQYSPRLEGRIKAFDAEIIQAQADAQKMVEKVRREVANDCYRHIEKAREYIEEEISYRSSEKNIGKKYCLNWVNKAMEVIKQKYLGE